MPPTILPDDAGLTLRHDPAGTSVKLARGIATTLCLLLGDAQSGMPLTAQVPLDCNGLDRIEALMRFWRLLHKRPPAVDKRLTPQRRRRLRRMLQATDGHLAGATYREIAAVIYGSSRIADEPWKTSALRDNTIDLVRDGRAMVNGGYRTLLRRRRRSR